MSIRHRPFLRMRVLAVIPIGPNACKDSLYFLVVCFYCKENRYLEKLKPRYTCEKILWCKWTFKCTLHLRVSIRMTNIKRKIINGLFYHGKTHEKCDVQRLTSYLNAHSYRPVITRILRTRFFHYHFEIRVC